MNSNQIIGQQELITHDLIRNKKIKETKNENYPVIGNPTDATDPFSPFEKYKYEKLNALKNSIDDINKNIVDNTLNLKIMDTYLTWINEQRRLLLSNLTELYTFYKFNYYKLTKMEDYYDVSADRLFSFALFMTNVENLSYLIGLVYNFAIIKKHFKEYKMRLYVDFHSIFGSPETFNIFNMFIDIIKTIDPQYQNTLQIVVFFLNPYFTVNDSSPYENLVTDLNSVTNYYNNILYNTSKDYIKSPLLNMSNNTSNTMNSNTMNSNTMNSNTMNSNTMNSNTMNSNTMNSNTTNSTGKNIYIDIDENNLNIEYIKTNKINEKTTFALLTCHIAVNLRFLPMNENCEFHVRDLDSRLSLSDKKIIEKFNNPKYQYVPYYVFQFYKYYFPFLKWRIDVNPYLAGCFGGDNRKQVMISEELRNSGNMKILKKELFFKYILFMSFNASNLQIGFLNDEFILANIFEKIKGKYSENILFLNLGAYSNKHVNDYYYGLHDSSNYPCILKLGVPIDILKYKLNGSYVTIDPITDFKIGNISPKYNKLLKTLIVEQLKIYMNYNVSETSTVSSKIRKNYNTRIDEPINDILESALFFSMVPKKFMITDMEDFNKNNYTSMSFNGQDFSSVGSSTNLVDNENLKSINFMMCGYLLSDVLENIIFPKDPEYINTNSYIDESNYDRLFNCLYFDEKTKSFLQKKITKDDISRKNIDQSFVDKIPDKYLSFTDKNEAKNSINTEFNEYLKTCKYAPSMNYYINTIPFHKTIMVDGVVFKTGILVFIKKYDKKIYDIDNNIINNIRDDDVKTLEFDKNNIKITKSLLRFNVVMFDDIDLYQMKYHDNNNNSKVNINIIKSKHIKKLAKYLKENNYSDYLIVDNI
jgi:hypothetical protein